MPDDMGVLDAPEVDAGIEEVESGIETAEEGAEIVEGAELDKPESDDPYTTKFSREMRAALKSWEQANPEAAKYAKQARDNHARLFSLNQIEPKGIDGVREKYALLDGLTRGDFKGPEALTAIQEELAAVEETDNLLASGDPRAFDALGEDFNDGLAKLAPAYLERIQKTDPAAFERAITPHIVSTLANSDLLKSFNDLVDVLNAQNDPRFDEKTKMQFTIQSLAKMGAWLNGLEQKVSKTAPVTPTGNGKSTPEEERTAIEKERQEIHWERNIYPQAGKAVETKFNELLAPFSKRLNLTPKQREAAFADFKAKNTKICEADKDYVRQRDLYRKQRNPDASAVLNMVRAQLAKSATHAFNAVKEERWGAFLAGKPKTTVPPIAVNGVKPKGPVGPNVEIRTVKPPSSEIDFKNTPVEWLRNKQYRLFSGKVIQLRVQ